MSQPDGKTDLVRNLEADVDGELAGLFAPEDQGELEAAIATMPDYHFADALSDEEWRREEYSALLAQEASSEYGAADRAEAADLMAAWKAHHEVR